MDPTHTFTQFINTINSHDLTALASLLTPDHLFVDSLGNRVQGAASMTVGWRGYFTLCPDYSVRIDHLITQDNLIFATGQADGTIDGIAWKIPAAWQSLIRDQQIAEWHVFADNKPVYDILARRQPPTPA